MYFERKIKLRSSVLIAFFAWKTFSNGSFLFKDLRQRWWKRIGLLLAQGAACNFLQVHLSFADTSTLQTLVHLAP